MACGLRHSGIGSARPANLSGTKPLILVAALALVVRPASTPGGKVGAIGNRVPIRVVR